MDDLLKLIETLRERIDSHRAELRKNEALTRSVLIDPLLRALGWDTENPVQVIPEYRIPSQRDKSADYALFADSDFPVIIVEAKKLGESLSGAAEQAVDYCNKDGYRHFAVTDGCQWTLYETHRPVPLEQKKIARFDLQSDSPIQVCSFALSLWRQRFVQSAPASGEPEWYARNLAERPSGAPVERRTQTSRDPSSDWVLLSRLSPEGGETPRELRLPSGDILGARKWSQLVPMLTKWLIDEGHLVEASLPIRATRSKHVVAAQPKHNDGSEFRAYQQVGRFFVNTHASGQYHAKHMRAIVSGAGQQADDFAVRTKKPNRPD